MKRRHVIVAAGVAAASLLSAALPVKRILVWNATASVPTGLYLLRGGRRPAAGDRVAIDPPPALQSYLEERGYLPSGVPLVKEVAAKKGDTVCRRGLAVSVNGRIVGRARLRDSAGRDLPVWQGCRTIAADEIFVMNPKAPASFDGRYFGVLARDRIIGRAQPLWTDEAGNGRHVWFARPAAGGTFSPRTEDNQGDAQ